MGNDPVNFVDPLGLYAGTAADAASFAVGFTPAGIAADLYTAGTGEDFFTGDEVTGFWRYAGVIPFVSEARKEGKVADVAKSGLREADNIANGPKLAQQLRLQSANSPFSKSGHLTDDAIKNSREIIPASAINNPAIPKGFSKYSTETFQSSSGNFQAHCYKNSKTGEVFYGNDYKVVFNAKSGG